MCLYNLFISKGNKLRSFNKGKNSYLKNAKDNQDK